MILPSERGDVPDELDPRTPLTPQSSASSPAQSPAPSSAPSPAPSTDQTPTAERRAADEDLKAKLAAVEDERERERQAAAEARKMVKNRFEQASTALEAAETEKAALAERLARAEAQAGNVGDAQSSLQAAKAENARLAEKLAAAEREALEAIDVAAEWQRRLTQAEAALEVARQQTALAAGRAASDEDERTKLRDALLDAKAEGRRWQETVLDQAAQIEQLKSALLQAEERHIKEMDEFLESLRAPRRD
jgi:chromosome segregation ATPase